MTQNLLVGSGPSASSTTCPSSTVNVNSNTVTVRKVVRDLLLITVSSTTSSSSSSSLNYTMTTNRALASIALSNHFALVVDEILKILKSFN